MRQGSVSSDVRENDIYGTTSNSKGNFDNYKHGGEYIAQNHVIYLSKIEII